MNCFGLPTLLHLPQYIRREIITHAQLRHPNVIAFLGVFRDDDNDGAPMIVLPFMENGSAMDYLKQLSAAELRNSSSSIVGAFNRAHDAILMSNHAIYAAVGCSRCTCILTRQESSCVSWRPSSSANPSLHSRFNCSPSDWNP